MHIRRFCIGVLGFSMFVLGEQATAGGGRFHLDSSTDTAIVIPTGAPRAAHRWDHWHYRARLPRHRFLHRRGIQHHHPYWARYPRGPAIVAGTPITVTGIAAMTTRIIGTIVSETRYVTSAAVASMSRRDIVVSGCALEQAQPGSCCVSISLLEPVYRVGEAPKGTPPA